MGEIKLITPARKPVCWGKKHTNQTSKPGGHQGVRGVVRQDQ
jgi:hypothetical protein